MRGLFAGASLLLMVAACDGTGAEEGGGPCTDLQARLTECGLSVEATEEFCKGAEEVIGAECGDLEAAFGAQGKADGFLGLYSVSPGRKCLFNVQCAGDLVCVPTESGLPSRQVCATPRTEDQGGLCDSKGDCAAGHSCEGETLFKNGRCIRGDDFDDGSGAAPVSELTLLTYNTGLAYDAVALAEGRKPAILDALQAEDADVVCLQEVWTARDVEEFKSALSGTYPYASHHRTEDSSGRSVGCGIFSTLKLSGCVSDKCEPEGISGEECVQDQCKSEYDALDEECQRCLAANTSSPTWCALWPGAKQFAWGGRNGLLMLSRTPMSDLEHTQFDTLLVRRSALSATVGGRRLHCTHLSSDLDVVPYPEGREMASWIEELSAQVDVIDGLTSDDECSVLLGDLNMGPATDTLDGEVADTWAKLEATGYNEDWSASERLCTWCADNPLTDGNGALQLDHVMSRGCNLEGASYVRAFDGAVAIEEGRASHDTRLSDHYGIRATLKFGAKWPLLRGGSGRRDQPSSQGSSIIAVKNSGGSNMAARLGMTGSVIESVICRLLA